MGDGRRIGKFRISREMVEDQPNIVRHVLGEFVIFHAEYKYAEDVFEYTALSDLFCPILSSCAIPFYEVSFNYDRGIRVI